MRVLIVKRDKLGDLLLTTPVLARIARAWPAAQIHLLANDYNAWVASGHPALARTWTYPRVRAAGRLRPRALIGQVRIAWQLRRERFDVALVMGGDESPRAIRRAIATGARRVIAYAADPSRYGRRLTDPLPVPVAGHEIERMLALLAPLGIAMDAGDAVSTGDVAKAGDIADTPRYELPADATAFAIQWLRERGLSPNGFVVLGLGARKAKKQPDTDQIVRWSERLFRQHGLPTVFMWTPGARDAGGYPGDDAIAAPVLAHGLPHLHPFRGPIVEAIALINFARTSILPDSGLMHFAAASPGGVLGLFADPADSAPAARWAPRGARVAWLEAPRRVSELADDAVLVALAPLLEPAATSIPGDTAQG